MSKSIKTIVEATKKLVAKKDEEIRLLKTELRSAKGEKTVTFKMPDDVEIRNFPTLQKVQVENQPDKMNVHVLNLKELGTIKAEVEFPKVQDVRILNTTEVQKVHVENQVEVEKASSWIPDVVLLAVKGIVSGLAKRIDMGITVKLDDSERMKPMPVIMVDTLGRPVKMNTGGGFIPVAVSNSGGSGGSPIIAESLDQYHISDGDETGTTKYYGFVTKDGAWYIMKNDTTANNYRYTKGASSYTTAWTGRASLTYGYFDVIF